MRENALVIISSPMLNLYLPSFITRLIDRFESITLISIYPKKILTAENRELCQVQSIEVLEFIYNGYLSKIKTNKEIVRTLVQKTRNQSTHIFITQPLELVTNYAAFQLSKQKNIKIDLFQEGIASFYALPVKKLLKRIIKQSILGFFCGVRYTPWQGSFLALGVVPYTSYWFVGELAGLPSKFLPTVKISPGKVESVVLKTKTRLLFIGQKTHSTKEKIAYYNALKNFSKCVDLEIDYRPHPSEKVDVGIIKSCLGESSVVLSTDGIAEHLATKYEVVVGIASSVLFNLKMLDMHQNVFFLDDPELLNNLSGIGIKQALEIVEFANEIGLISTSSFEFHKLVKR